MTAHVAAQDQSVEVYQPKDAIGSTIKATAMAAGAGLFISSIQAALTKQNVGAMSVFTRTGGTIALLAAVGGTYEFAKCASANLRQKEDTWNVAYAGFLSGGVIGLRYRSTPAIFGFGAAVSVVASTFSYTGGKLSGYDIDPDVDEVSRKEFLRKNRRRPIEETINELGEGRGIYGPGYQQRRAERLKERYGIDVPLEASSS